MVAPNEDGRTNERDLDAVKASVADEARELADDQLEGVAGGRGIIGQEATAELKKKGESLRNLKL